MSTRRSLITLIALVGVVGLILVSVGSASGLHGDPSDDNVLRLHLDSDGDYFAHDGLPPQQLTETGCLVDGGLDGPLVSIVGSNKGAGLSFDSLGTKSKGPGRSCGRLDGTETLSIALDNGPADDLEGLNLASMELDIEAKQDAWVEATLTLSGDVVGVFELRSGGSIEAGVGTDPDPDTPWLAESTSVEPIANCLVASDSGADSGDRDNCRWVVDPDVPFDTVAFAALEGEFGIEGGEDGTLPATSGENSDSLFYLTDVGILDCGDIVETGDAIGAPRVTVERQLQAGCILKEYLLSSGAFGSQVAGTQSFSFAPSGGNPDATYRMTVTWVPEPAANPLPVTQMDYDNNGTGDGDLQWCDGDAASPVFPSDGAGGTLPWCRTAQEVTLVGTGFVQMVEHLFGTGDPNGWR